MRGQPRYFVLYEVAQLATLSGEPYLARLNSPSAWTQKMMPHYRGMRRGFCTVAGSFGIGLGNVAALFRFRPDEQAAASLQRWLIEEALPELPGQPGLGGAHLLVGAATPSMTSEQRIRGADAGVDWALVITGYEPAVLEESAIRASQLESRGALEVQEALYRFDYTLSHAEVAA